MLTVGAAPAEKVHGRARVLVVAGTGTMTVAWLAIWAALLGRVGAGSTLAGPSQEIVLLAAATLAAWLPGRSLGERPARAIFTGGTVLVLLAAAWALYYRDWLPGDPRWLALLWHSLASSSARGAVLASLAPVPALCWAGGRIGAADLDEYQTFRFFGFGLAGLFGALFACALAGSRAPSPELSGTATAIFFVAAFLTLPFAQIISARERGSATVSRLQDLDRRWLIPVGTATVLILLVALLLSATMAGTLIGSAASALGRVPDLVLYVLQPLIVVVFMVLEGVMALLRWVADGIGALLPHSTVRQVGPVHMPPPPRALHGAGESTKNPHLPELLSLAIRWGALVIGVIAVTTALSRAMPGFGGLLRRERGFDEERDSVWSWQEARSGARARLKQLGAHLRGPRRTAQHGAPTSAPRSIREAYRRMLRLFMLVGRPRAGSETPDEYLARLRLAPTSGLDDAALLTSAYVGVRYGDEPERAEDLASALRALGQLERALDQARRAADSGEDGGGAG